MRPLNPKAQTAAAALALTLLVSHTVLAQAVGGDVIGASNARDAFIAFLKICALGGIGWGFFQMLTGSHRIAGLVTVAVGAAGIAKIDTVAGLFGL